MNLLYAENISKAYGEKLLFKNITVSINKGQKVALIARNGTGKTSLLEILAGNDGADSGKVLLHQGSTLGYLPQNPEFEATATVMEAIFSGNNKTLQLLQRYETCLAEQQRNPTTDNNALLAKLTADIDALQAWDYEAKIKEILSKLKINDLNKRTAQLSGGQRKRLALAAILIKEPDLMILDEPTNHLDIEMIEWLEKYLNRPSITLLLVTHDRYFLDKICDEIIELRNGILQKYKGNYAYFVEKRAELDHNRSQEIETARTIYRREIEWMRQTPQARTTKAKSRIDAFYDIQETAQQRTEVKQAEIAIKMQRLGSKILELHSVEKKYDDTPILKKFDYKFKRFDRIGIVGKNGVGKTTFLNMLMALEQPDYGTIKQGDTIVFGYYRQDYVMDESKRVIEVVRDVAEYIELEKGQKLTALQLLHRFLFPNETHYNYVYKLSGGEKRRLHLLTVLMRNPNFLILDEPTNDLDIDTLNVLEDFLQQFGGVLVVVTHDRYFMDKLVEHLFVFEGNGEVRDFPGNYTDYRNWLEEQVPVKTAKDPEKAANTVQNATTTATKPKTKLSYKEKQELEQIEKDLPRLEQEKTALEAKIGAGGSSNDIMQWSQQLSTILMELENKENRWLELSELV